MSLWEYFKNFSAYWDEPFEETFPDALPPFEPFFPDAVSLPHHEYTVAEGRPAVARFIKDRLSFYRANLIVREMAELPENAKGEAHYNFYLRLERAAVLGAPPAAVHYFKLKNTHREDVVASHVDHWNNNDMGVTGKYLAHFAEFVPLQSWMRDGAPIAWKNGLRKSRPPVNEPK